MYKRFDKMVIYMTNTDMFLVLPGEAPKHAAREGNEMQYDILSKQPDISKEEFEQHIKTKNVREALFEALYWKTLSESKPIFSGTPEQRKRIDELTAQGYVWDKEDSAAAAGVVLKKGEDTWFFGLGGEIMHNPQGLTIKTK
jgi:hypothetical protein